MSTNNKSLLKAVSIISLGTVASRILGFIRDVVIANFFGTGFAAEAFFIAFRIPNMLRDLVGEGSANAALVPVFSEYLLKKDRREFFRLVASVFYIFLIALSLLAVAGIALSPVIVRLIAPGFAADTAKLDLTVHLTRIIFPYLILIGLTAYSMGVLNTLKIFAPGAVSPCLLNLALIAGAVISSMRLKEPAVGLAASVLIGGVLQLLVQMPPLMRQGFRFMKVFEVFHPGARQIGRLLMPRALGSAVYQLNVFVDTICASFSVITGTGAIAAIYYANRLIQFPLAVFGIAFASALLPTLSGCVVQNDMKEFKSTLSFSLRKIVFLMIPSSVALAVMATPIVRVFFQRGAFSAYSTTITSYALVLYALGLCAFGATKILICSFYSLRDTVTPVKVAVASLVINVVLNVILMFPLKVGGLALASSLSATVNFCVLFVMLKRRIGDFLDADFPNYCMRVLAASLMMGLVMIALWKTPLAGSQAIKLLVTFALSGICFLLSCLILNIREAQALKRWLLRKK